MAEMKESWTSLASLLAILAFCQTLLQVAFKPELWFASLGLLKRALGCYSSYCYFDVAEWDGDSTNELYNAVQLILSSFASASRSRLYLSRTRNASAATFVLSKNDYITDVFHGVAVQWERVVTQRQFQTSSWQPQPDEKRGFTLRIRKRDKVLILYPYLDYITDKANDICRNNRERLICTNSGGGSKSVPFKHPGTFDAMAMDLKRKRDIMEDLRDFAAGQGFYQRTGRAWKRGYLLQCLPGTGKSSMIAAMANFLGYDIYDLELTEVSSNSGLLNFTDGLYSCRGSERIFVFTTNHIDKLDPALLWSGRMDMHIHMSYCSYPALKILLQDYLGCEAATSELREAVEKAKVTPADISEVLIKNRRNKEKAVGELLEVLKARAERNEKYGGLREERESNRVEEEKQEKRALENRVEREGSAEDDSCKKVEDGEEGKAK